MDWLDSARDPDYPESRDNEEADVFNKATACDCDACVRFKKAAAQIDDVTWWTDDESARAVAKAQQAVWEARKTLHRLHKLDRVHMRRTRQHIPGIPDHRKYVRAAHDCPFGEERYARDLRDEMGRDDDWSSSEYERESHEYGAISRWSEEYDGGSWVGNGDLSDHWEGSDEQANNEYDNVENASREHDEYRPHERYEGKFMVCDHCHGHALPCNEAQVCDQCQLSGTPCIKRWCSISPSSIEDCPNPNCRYAHSDHLPVPADAVFKSNYIVLPGDLRPYLMDGRVPRKEWTSAFVDCMSFAVGVRGTQIKARNDLNRWVQEGCGSLENTYCNCGEHCGKDSARDNEPFYQLRTSHGTPVWTETSAFDHTITSNPAWNVSAFG